MNKPRSRYPRHFPYKNPVFGTKNRPNPERAWRKSEYYWGWEYLGRKPKYLKPCQSGGRGRMAALYRDFGDVRKDDFKAWWTEKDRGAELFAEPPVDKSVHVVTQGNDVLNTHQF